MLKGSLSASGSSLRGPHDAQPRPLEHRRRPVRVPEPGRVDLELVAKNKVIGSGAKTSATNGKSILTVKLTTAGRKLLKRSKKLKVTRQGRVRRVAQRGRNLPRELDRDNQAVVCPARKLALALTTAAALTAADAARPSPTSASS